MTSLYDTLMNFERTINQAKSCELCYVYNPKPSPPKRTMNNKTTTNLNYYTYYTRQMFEIAIIKTAVKCKNANSEVAE